MKNKEESFLRINIGLGEASSLRSSHGSHASHRAMQKAACLCPSGFDPLPCALHALYPATSPVRFRHPSLSHVRLYAYPIPHGTKPLSRHILTATRFRYSTVGCVPLTLGLVMATATDRQLTSRFTQGGSLPKRISKRMARFAGAIIYFPLPTSCLQADSKSDKKQSSIFYIIPYDYLLFLI